MIHIRRIQVDHDHDETETKILNETTITFTVEGRRGQTHALADHLELEARRFETTCNEAQR